MSLRRVHIIIGLIMGPFLAVTAVSGVLILATGRFWELLFWHSWFKFGGIVLGVGLTFLAVSGWVLYLRTMRRKRR